MSYPQQKIESLELGQLFLILPSKFLTVNLQIFSNAFPFLISIALIFSSCGAQSAKVKFPGEFDVKQMTAFYANTLPCADCPGIFTELQFYTDSSFLLYRHYLDRDSIPEGAFGKWINFGRVIQLQLPKGEKMNLLYNGKDMLLLDENQDVIEDDIKYALLRQPEASINLEKTFKLEAKYSTLFGNPSIHVCNVNNDFPIMNLNAYDEALQAYENRKHKDKDFFALFEVHIEILPMGPNERSVFLVIDRFRHPLDYYECPQ